MLDIRFNTDPSGNYYLEKLAPTAPLSINDLTDDGYLAMDIKDFKWQPVRDVYGDIVTFPADTVSLKLRF